MLGAWCMEQGVLLTVIQCIYVNSILCRRLWPILVLFFLKYTPFLVTRALCMFLNYFLRNLVIYYEQAVVIGC